MNILRFMMAALVIPLLGATELPPIPNEDLDGLSYTSSQSVTMTVLGKTYSWEVTYEDIASTPVWDTTSGEEPPLSIPEAIEVSKPQISRYFPDVSEWVLESIVIETLGWGKYWFYVVKWKAKRHHEGDYLEIPVLMSGQPVYLNEKE
jgi:hypothetical protein